MAKITQNAVTVRDYLFLKYLQCYCETIDNYTPTKFVPPFYCLKVVETTT